MPTVAILSLVAALFGLMQPPQPGLHRSTFPLEGRAPMPYAIATRRGYDGQEARPLVLARHPGGARIPYYGAAFVEQIVGCGLDGLRVVIVAPDCPTQAWTDPIADRAVMALLDRVLADYRIDRRRILVTGFSLGGRGTWFLASRHADDFTAAIPMAAAIGDEPLDALATMPTYVIHSREDQVVGTPSLTAIAVEFRCDFERLDVRHVFLAARGSLVHDEVRARDEPNDDRPVAGDDSGAPDRLVLDAADLKQ